MMGWAMLLGFAFLSAALLVLLRFPARLWMIAATAITLGAAGYAWQGTPGLAGSPAEPQTVAAEVDPHLVAMREALFGRFTLEDAYFKQADAMARRGHPDLAARAMMGAVNKVPDDAALWAWLGVTLADNDHGLTSPAARYAFDRAIELAPRHAGPHYFLAHTLSRSGQLVEARAELARAVELVPPAISYRADLVDQLAQLDAFLARQDGAGGAADGAGPAPE